MYSKNKLNMDSGPGKTFGTIGGLILIIAVIVGAVFLSRFFNSSPGSFSVTFDEAGPSSTTYVSYDRYEKKDGVYIGYKNGNPVFALSPKGIEFTETFLEANCMGGYKGAVTIEGSIWGNLTFDNGTAYIMDTVEFTSAASISDVREAVQKTGGWLTGQEKLASGGYIYTAEYNRRPNGLDLDEKIRQLGETTVAEGVKRKSAVPEDKVA